MFASQKATKVRRCIDARDGHTRSITQLLRPRDRNAGTTTGSACRAQARVWRMVVLQLPPVESAETLLRSCCVFRFACDGFRIARIIPLRWLGNNIAFAHCSVIDHQTGVVCFSQRRGFRNHEVSHVPPFMSGLMTGRSAAWITCIGCRAGAPTTNLH